MREDEINSKRWEEKGFTRKSFGPIFHHLPFIEPKLLIINASINGDGNL